MIGRLTSSPIMLAQLNILGELTYFLHFAGRIESNLIVVVSIGMAFVVALLLLIVYLWKVVFGRPGMKIMKPLKSDISPTQSQIFSNLPGSQSFTQRSQHTALNMSASRTSRNYDAPLPYQSPSRSSQLRVVYQSPSRSSQRRRPF